MKYRYLSIILILLIVSIGAVSAQEDTASDDIVGVEQDSEVLSANEFIIDDSNYDNYFDESGMILENSSISDGDTIKLGNVNNKDIVLNRTLTVTSNSSSDVLNNVTIILYEGSSNSIINDLQINTSAASYSPIIVYASDVTISEISIDVVNVDEGDFYAIYALGADNLNITTNVIHYVGNTNGTSINNAVRVEDSKKVVFANNTLFITVPSVDVVWDEIPPASGNWVSFPASEGIVFDNVTDLTFSENIINLDANNVITAYGYDTIYVVDVDSDNAVVEGNTIIAEGKDYVYGIVVSGDNFNVTDNTFRINATNYACGIDVEGPAVGIVKDNSIHVASPVVAYGIYGAMSNGNVSVDYTNNTITGNSYAVFGMELSGIASNVEYNSIVLIGNHTTGIASRLNEVVIGENNIITLGSGIGDMYVWDGFGVENVGIKLIEGTVYVSNNQIASTGKGIHANLVNLDLIANTIAVADTGLADSYGVYFCNSNISAETNIFIYRGKTNSTFINNAMYVEDCTSKGIINNSFEIDIPSVDVVWDEIPAASGNWVSFPASEGIVFNNVTDLKFSDNIITLNATDVITAYGYDTIYAVDVKSDNAVVGGNTIIADGKDYVYGLIISGENFNVTDNLFQINATNYACGIDVEGPASGVVSENSIYVTSPVVAYGIYGAMSNGNVSVDYESNNITGNSYAVFGMELSGIASNVEYNNIVLIGNHTTGIASRLNELIIGENNIITSGSGVGDMYVWDGFGVENVGIKLIAGTIYVSNNKIASAGKGIYADEVNLALIDNVIGVVDTGLDDSYGVYVLDSNVSAENNNITYVGKTNSTFINNAMYIADSTSKGIKDNTFDISIPSVDVIWEEIPAASGNWVSFPASEGIVFDNVTDLVFSDNNVILNATDVITAYGYDTIYVVDVNSDNAVIEGNKIFAEGKDYIYGLIISGDNFTVSDNEFAIDAAYYSCGIDVEGPASGIVSDNLLMIYSPTVAYPVYAAMSNGNVSVEYLNNVIQGIAYAVWGMELGGIDATVTGNTIDLEGNYTTGIAVRVSGSADITNNEINLYASNTGDMYVWDGFGVETVGIHALLGDITAKYNTITTTGNYTVNTAAEGEVTDNYLVAAELLGDESVNATNDTLVENNIPIANATNYNLTNDTFYLFFTEEGDLRDNITSESLTFIGEFSNLNLWNVIDRPIKLLSDNATLYDMSFTILSDNVTVDGFTFISELANTISVIGNDVSIINNNFTVAGEGGDDYYVIYVYESENVFIDSNNINLTVESDDTFENKAIYAFGSNNLTITKNNITATIPSRSINWTSGQVYSEAVGLEDCDAALIVENIITAGSNGQIGDYDTIYALRVTGDDALITNNLIGAGDGPYSYAVVITGENFTISDNLIGVNTEGNYACGIDVESNSYGVIEDNVIGVNATASSYGIYTANWGGDVVTNITNNGILAEANSAFAMSLTGSEALVSNNTIYVEGNYTTGIASKVDSIVIDNNTIEANGTNVGTPLGYDSMGIETTGVHIVSGEAVVTNNNITTTGEFAVDAKGTGNVTDNYLVASEYTGDAAVDNVAGDTLVLNNTPAMQRVVIQAEDVVMYYRNGTRYVVLVTDQNGNPLPGEKVTLTVNGASYNRTTNENGTASMAINLPAGNYTASVAYIGTGDCLNATQENNITVMTTVFGDDLVKIFRNASQYYATFLDGQGNLLTNGTATFNINGVMYERKINENGTAKLNINLEAGEYIITAINPVNGEMHANNITVLSSITDNADLVKYYRNASQYVVTVLGADGKAVGAGETVTFNINGVLYTRQTNASGQAKLNINLEAGNYTITAEYNGCRVSNNIEVKPVLYANDLVKKYGVSDQFRALLLDGQGNPFPGQTVTFNINGVFYQRTTDADGYAALTIRLGAAKDVYIITSSYNGTNISNKITITD